jgi:hypothetical protein
MLDMWSNRDAQWSGFQPVECLLDANKVFSLSFTRVNKNGADLDEPIQTTLADVLQETTNWHVKNVEHGFAIGSGGRYQITISADPESMKLLSVEFNCHLLKTLVDLRSANVNPFYATWFWYGASDMMEEPNTAYTFFVVHGDKIVNERVTLFDAPDSGFDPTVFDDGGDNGREIWSDDDGWRIARLRFWYRKFYRETPTGQLMVLRSDEPRLFHCPEGELARLAYAEPDSETNGELTKRLATLVLTLLLGK